VRLTGRGLPVGSAAVDSLYNNCDLWRHARKRARSSSKPASLPQCVGTTAGSAWSYHTSPGRTISSVCFLVILFANVLNMASLALANGLLSLKSRPFLPDFLLSILGWRLNNTLHLPCFFNTLKAADLSVYAFYCATQSYRYQSFGG
jgi:hypothetical protein